jgi:uncharacterized membrane protein
VKSRANIAGHPIHPILVTVPLGLWPFSVVADLIYVFGWGPDAWKTTAFYCLGGGLIGAIPAIITGYIDYTGIHSNAAARVAKFHLWLNVAVFVILAVDFAWRWPEAGPPFSVGPLVLSIGSLLLLGISGWLGGELISKYQVSVRGTDEEGSENPG